MHTLQPKAYQITRLEKPLDSVKPLKIVGLLDPIGVGGFKGAGERWSLIVTLVDWKVPGGSLQGRKLRLEKFVPYEALKTYQESLRLDTPYQLKIWTAGEDVPHKAALGEVLGASDDAELLALAQEMQKPVVWHDAQWGEFTLDRAYDGFHCNTHWGESKVRLTLSLRNGEGREDCLDTARALWDAQRVWTKKVIDCGVNRLLKLKNEHWLRDDEEEALHEAQFISCLTLQSIIVEPGGAFSFWYDDGGLFSGHTIFIEGNLNDGATRAEIVG